MKTVLTNSQVAHVWAQQTQSTGRNAGNTFYFRDSMIFSYGSHYMAAKIHTVKGKKIALINARGYSSSTAKHLSDIRSALRGLMPYYNIKSGNIEDLKAASEEIDLVPVELIAHALKVKKVTGKDDYKWPVNNIETAYNEANEFRKLLGKKALKFKDSDLKAIKDHYAARLKRYKELNTPEMIAKKEKLREKRNLLANEKLLTENAERIAKFRRGEYSGTINTPYPLLRIQGDEVVTSRGARVPLELARQLLKRVLYKKDVEGMPIGSFTVVGVTDKIVKIGCHEIEIQEAVRVLGVA